ncbi:MAG: hypothetical protein WD030_07905, partial [Pirellulales bacterium]
GNQQGGEQSSQQDPNTTSTSDQQSDSQGESEGTHSGGGKQGGGQGADQQGKGAAGSNTPDDSGSGAAEESGMGEEGQGPNGQQQTDQPSEAGSRQPGDQREGEGGQQSNEGERPSQQQGEGQPGDQGRQGGEQGDPRTEGDPSGPSHSEDHQPGGERSAGEYADTEVDEANLDYARKATDLALEHLENELQQGKTELLDRTGMTREEAEARIRRWKELKERAGAPTASEQAKRELDERLRSLGLRSGNERVRTGTPSESRVERMRDSNRSDAPSEYSEGFEAFRRGIFRSGIRREE